MRLNVCSAERDNKRWNLACIQIPGVGEEGAFRYTGFRMSDPQPSPGWSIVLFCHAKLVVSSLLPYSKS